LREILGFGPDDPSADTMLEVTHPDDIEKSDTFRERAAFAVSPRRFRATKPPGIP
jgi:hypothetical protein